METAVQTSMRNRALLPLPAHLYAEQGLCNGRASVRPTVRLSVSLSVPSIDSSKGGGQVC